MAVFRHNLCVSLFTCSNFCACILLLDRHLVAIERDRQPQVMRIVHNDDDDDSDNDYDDDDENKGSSNDYDEGVHSLSLVSDREDKEGTQEGRKTGHRDAQSPDSLFQSPSPGCSFCFLSYPPTLTYKY